MTMVLGEHVVGVLALTAEDITQELRSRIEVFPEGEYVHHQAGKMTVTAEHLQQLADDVNERGDKIPLDYDHSFGKGDGSLAAGWFIRGSASLEPSTSDALKKSLWADVQWTPRAAEAIRSGEYRFISPEWNFRWKDNTGKVHQRPRLFAAALTNRPFFEQMGPVNLCEGDIASLIAADPMRRKRCESCGSEYAGETCQACDITTASKSAEKEGQMDTKAIAESLGLAADATDAEILAAITARNEAAEKAATLEAEKAELEKRVLPEDKLAELTANAAKGLEAANQLEELEMNTLLDSAIRERKIDPAEREHYATLYAANKDGVKALLDAKKAGSFDPIGGEGSGLGGSRREAQLAETGDHGALYGFNPPSKITVDGAEMDVDKERSELHVAALELLKAEGKILTYTADEYVTACSVAAQTKGIRL